MSNVTIVNVNNNSFAEFVSSKKSSLVVDCRRYTDTSKNANVHLKALREAWGNRLSHHPELTPMPTDTVNEYLTGITQTVNTILSAVKAGKPVILIGHNQRILKFLADALLRGGVVALGYYDYQDRNGGFKGCVKLKPLTDEEASELVESFCLPDDDEALSNDASFWGL